mgnify:FL=1
MKVGIADKELRKAYEAFGRMVTAEEVYREETLTFEDVCRRIGIETGALDRLIFSEMGMTGRQLMAAYREGIVPGRINDFL